MTARAPRFEVVRSDAGWHARFVAGNGQVLWQTEVYVRQRTASRAVALVAWALGASLRPDGVRPNSRTVDLPAVEIRHVDERSTTSTARAGVA